MLEDVGHSNPRTCRIEPGEVEHMWGSRPSNSSKFGRYGLQQPWPPIADPVHFVDESATLMWSLQFVANPS